MCLKHNVVQPLFLLTLDMPFLACLRLSWMATGWRLYCFWGTMGRGESLMLHSPSLEGRLLTYRDTTSQGRLLGECIHSKRCYIPSEPLPLKVKVCNCLEKKWYHARKPPKMCRKPAMVEEANLSTGSCRGWQLVGTTSFKRINRWRRMECKNPRSDRWRGSWWVLWSGRPAVLGLKNCQLCWDCLRSSLPSPDPAALNQYMAFAPLHSLYASFCFLLFSPISWLKQPLISLC